MIGLILPHEEMGIERLNYLPQVKSQSLLLGQYSKVWSGDICMRIAWDSC